MRPELSLQRTFAGMYPATCAAIDPLKDIRPHFWPKESHSEVQ